MLGIKRASVLTARCVRCYSTTTTPAPPLLQQIRYTYEAPIDTRAPVENMIVMTYKFFDVLDCKFADKSFVILKTFRNDLKTAMKAKDANR